MSDNLSPLDGIYLDDSYFLGISVSGTTFRIRCLFALTADHADYAAPVASEQHCYREGEIRMAGVAVAEWRAGQPTVLVDPDGSVDLGSIEFSTRDGHYTVSTEWFEMVCRSESVDVLLD